MGEGEGQVLLVGYRRRGLAGHLRFLAVGFRGMVGIIPVGNLVIITLILVWDGIMGIMVTPPLTALPITRLCILIMKRRRHRREVGESLESQCLLWSVD